MAAPKPGKKLRSSKTGRPIMAALDLLGRRWALRILWELHRNGPGSFREIQRLCGDISPTVLNTRLSELRETGIIELRGGEGYVITEEGIALGKIIMTLNEWAERWAGNPGADKASRPGNAKSLPGRKNK